MKNWGFGCAALVVARMTVSLPANAAEEPLGKQGQLVIDNRFQLMGTNTKPAGDPESFQSLQLNPSAAYFVLANLSLGLGVSVGYQNTDEFGRGKQTTLSAAPRVGYVVPLGDKFDLYPEVELQFARTSFSVPWVVHTCGVGASVPVLFRPASHFFVGLGPGFAQRWSWQEMGGYEGEYHRFEVSLRSTIGGYFEL